MGGAPPADRSLFGPGANPPRDRTAFLFVRGRLLRPLVPLVAAPAERVQRPRPQCDAPNPCPVPCQNGGENPRIEGNHGGIARSAACPAFGACDAAAKMVSCRRFRW